MTHEQELKMYGGVWWEQLLAESWKGRVVHGEKLVMAMSCADNVDRARRCWRAAEKLGLVVRRSYRPTVQQQFFGLNSQFGRAVLDPEKTDHDPVACEWEFC